MEDKQAVGQYVARLLAVLGALASGDPVRIMSEPSFVEVTGLSRDNHPGAPVYITYVTAGGRRTCPVEQFDIDA